MITRKITNNKILIRLEDLLTVQYIAGALNISPQYLRSLLKQLTGLSTQQHIHNKLIEKVKDKLPATNLSVSKSLYETGSDTLSHSASSSRQNQRLAAGIQILI